ncbi:Crp/Fnr family transcriptional regulator [Ramlibacter monticola]|uniref:Crp/Fnr family transcriptional regulator n=1 Tax=Ramlibacter monticola TaxID=1926872 RepID=A0A936Z9X9_9BURK|nr:Crp/Fnr family transcriptional regulator [Ramlibacter monticola]MBL0395152.1 Crp/Fnr family transcriptional regulator [Ramlibacter monticola]
MSPSPRCDAEATERPRHRGHGAAATRKENVLNAPRDAPGAANGLLAALPVEDRARFLAGCQKVQLQMDQVLASPGEPMAHAWFPTSAVLSLAIAPPETRQWLEVALVGSEGMVGLPLLLGVRASTMRVTVLRAGAALCIGAAPLRRQLLASRPLRTRLQRYVLVVLTQMARAALCTRYHKVDERLARWLLMAQDRAPRQDLHATHESLSASLGVRRAGVTRAAAGLQERRLIAYHRGVVTLLDRRALKRAACSCYASDRASYAALMRSHR